MRRRLLHDVDLAGRVARHKQALLAVDCETSRSEAITWTCRRVLVAEDRDCSGGAICWFCGLAVGEGDNGELVSGGIVSVPAAVEGNVGQGARGVEFDVEGCRVGLF